MAEIRKPLRSILLNERESIILDLNDKEFNGKEIAFIMNMTEQMVSRIINKVDKNKNK